VLIRGESGTGKELVARAIYQHSPRSEAPFLAINCAAIPESLLESELFGHEKGSFTGAEQRRIGKFEQCSGGTLFLDEIGDMSPLTQGKVLRVLQDQRFERVGGSQTIQTNTRTIAATHRPLEKMLAEGTFRDDLYYRLNVFTIRLPPLRERLEDLPLLVNTFLKRFSREMGREVRMAAPGTLEILAQHDWPGNMRELQGVLKQALLRASGPVLLPGFLPKHFLEQLEAPKASSLPGEQTNESEFIHERLQADSQNLYAEWFARVERQLLVQVLQFTNGNQLNASKLLGITRRSLRGKILTHGIAIERSVSTANNGSQ
jgi:two-component system nitrogen regulation response regulator GlnG